jgi:hypothetical protein
MATSISPPVSAQDQPSIRFTSIKDLVRAINHVSGDFLMVTDVSPTDFNEVNLSREYLHPPRRFRLRRYNTETHILFITIPTAVHEKLHLLIYQNFEHQLARRGIEDNWISLGATTFFPVGHPRGHGNGGEGDSTGGPDPARLGKDAWPSFVIDAGDSESLHELRNDMRWWFAASDNQVKLVVLAKFDHGQAAILIERWEPCATRPGATTTRRAAAPVLQQSITITRNATTNPVSYLVIGGPLVLPFRLLFLRDPGPQEGDFVMSVPELESYARTVWVYA